MNSNLLFGGFLQPEQQGPQSRRLYNQAEQLYKGAGSGVTVWHVPRQTTYFCSPHPGVCHQTTAPSLGLFGSSALPFGRPADIFLLLSSDVLLPASWVQVPYQRTLGAGWVVFLIVLVWRFSEAEGKLLNLASPLSLEKQKQNL